MLIGIYFDYYLDMVMLNMVGVKEFILLEYCFYLEFKFVFLLEFEFDIFDINEFIVLENILYDFDSDWIWEEVESDLCVVFEILNDYLEMVIELSFYIDSQGGDDYNKDFFQCCVEFVCCWLVCEGIDCDCIVVKGYGES